MSGKQVQKDSSLVVSDKKEVRKTPFYNVVLHNDNYTSVNFVVELLMVVFRKKESEAIDLTMKIHHEQKAIVAKYIKEIAESKQNEVMKIAEINKFPLLCTVEEEEPESEPTSGRKMKR